jgi:hypothetical protein
MLTEREWDNVFMFSLSGIPGVGKSTAMEELKSTPFLQEELNKVYQEKLISSTCAISSLVQKQCKMKIQVVTVQEPSDLWRKLGYLQAFYGNPNANALSFQMIVFDTHVNAVQQAMASFKNDPFTILIILVERSMWDQLLFWKLQIDMKRSKDDLLDDDSYMGIWYKWLYFVPPLSKIFYCKTRHLDTTMERVHMRARKEELGLKHSTCELGRVSSPPPRVEEEEEKNEENEKNTKSGLTRDYMYLLNEKHDTWYTQGMARVPQENQRCKTLESIGIHKEIEPVPCTLVDMDLPYHNDLDQVRALAQFLAREMIEEII